MASRIDGTVELSAEPELRRLRGDGGARWWEMRGT